MAGCSGSCSSCNQDCAQRDLKATLNKKSSVKKVIGILSGKGGVGKSLVTSLLASKVCKDGFRTAILDADITGPSIPHIFGLKEKAMGTEDGITPIESANGSKNMSINLLLDNDTDPVAWRGPIL
ncbi:MAG: Mrp/NBP35 family ATP-binding protein, partial [Treponema sp.]|nr:Mrp/NBP35 family ATP-binding protein [Treponema sp.]